MQSLQTHHFRDFLKKKLHITIQSCPVNSVLDARGILAYDFDTESVVAKRVYDIESVVAKLDVKVVTNEMSGLLST